MEKVISKSIRLIDEGSFPSQALASLAWAFRTMKVDNQHLFNSVSKEVTLKFSRQDVQHCVTMLPLGLACANELGRHVGKVIYHLLHAMPQSLDDWWSDRYEQIVVGLKIDHFGFEGTRFLNSKLGIHEAPSEFARGRHRVLKTTLRRTLGHSRSSSEQEQRRSVRLHLLSMI